MRNTGLGFGLLGPLLMTANGARMPLGAPKQRAVLAMLVINRNRPVSVDALINAVWDEDPVRAARTSIQSHVCNLRRLLRTAGVDPYSVLASAPPGYQLSVADADCDLVPRPKDRGAAGHCGGTIRGRQQPPIGCIR
jgi:DNA-binding SARP family transcriptional activator